MVSAPPIGFRDEQWSESTFPHQVTSQGSLLRNLDFHWFPGPPMELSRSNDGQGQLSRIESTPQAPLLMPRYSLVHRSTNGVGYLNFDIRIGACDHHALRPKQPIDLMAGTSSEDTRWDPNGEISILLGLSTMTSAARHFQTVQADSSMELHTINRRFNSTD